MSIIMNLINRLRQDISGHPSAGLKLVSHDHNTSLINTPESEIDWQELEIPTVLRSMKNIPSHKGKNRKL